MIAKVISYVYHPPLAANAGKTISGTVASFIFLDLKRA